jgi:formylmethanofuran dehydrogenase subunit E
MENSTTANDANDQLPDAGLFATLLAASKKRHEHLCPRQVLGVRMGLFGLRQLDLLGAAGRPYDNQHKHLLTIMETDGCGADGVAVATDCQVGRRTLRIIDFGKMAATFTNTVTEHSIRVTPSEQSREFAAVYAPEARSRWHAYLEAYEIMPDQVLFDWQPVQLFPSVGEIISRPGIRVLCTVCGEEIINEREVVRDGRIFCRSCAGESYYVPLSRTAASQPRCDWPQFSAKSDGESC